MPNPISRRSMLKGTAAGVAAGALIAAGVTPAAEADTGKTTDGRTKAGRYAAGSGGPTVTTSIIYSGHPAYVYSAGGGFYQARCPVDHSTASGTQQWRGPWRFGPGAKSRATDDKWKHIS